MMTTVAEYEAAITKIETAIDAISDSGGVQRASTEGNEYELMSLESLIKLHKHYKEQLVALQGSFAVNYVQFGRVS